MEEREPSQTTGGTTPLLDGALIEAFLNHIPSLAIQGYREDGTIFYWNRASERIYGYSVSEAIGGNLLHLIIPPPMREEARASLQHAAQTGEARPAGELTLFNKEGCPVHVYSNHMDIKAVTGETRFYCLDVDLTESKDLEHRLRTINHTLLEFRESPQKNIQKLTELMGTLLHADCVLYNRAQRDLLCTVAAWHPPPDLPMGDSAKGHLCREVIARGGQHPLVVRDLPNTAFAQSDPNIHKYKLKTYVGHPVISNHRTIGSLCALFLRDVEPTSKDLEVLSLLAAAIGMEEERGSLRDHLLRTQKQEAIGRLAGGVAHDVNNILTALSGFTEFIEMDAGDDPILAPHLRGIQTCIQRISLLANQLLTFSQRRELQMSMLDLNQVVRDAKPMMEHTLGDLFGIALSLDPEPCYTNGDTEHLEQVLLSLALNAKEAMREPGAIEVGTLATPRTIEELEGLVEAPATPKTTTYVTLFVRDTGVGMSQETRDKIFEPFFSTKEFGQSTGLGLPTVYGIVRQHRGLIGINSLPDQGTTFFIYLPTNQPTTFEGPRRGMGSAETRPGTKPTVLLVEDDPSILIILQKSLEQAGFPVHTAPNAEKALELLQQKTIPLQFLITDIVMPGMNGKELADTLRTHIPGLPVLFMTGYIPEKVEACGLNLEHDHILYKPFMPRQVIEKINQVLKQPV
ncbi:MAG: response regulator [Kiritimatiellae bacterium]|nr:response regulator [Kiritimatiellia bacterium]